MKKIILFSLITICVMACKEEVSTVPPKAPCIPVEAVNCEDGIEGCIPVEAVDCTVIEEVPADSTIKDSISQDVPETPKDTVVKV